MWSPQSMERFLTAWVETVNDYLQRQYREIIQQEASPETLSQYKLECKWLLRSALKLESMVKDPEYPAPHFRPEIAGKLLQLQESWQSLNNSMTEGEAEAILQKVFRTIISPTAQQLFPLRACRLFAIFSLA